MKSQDKPEEPTQPINADAQLLAWTELRDQMQRLHAELEYLRLMLRLGALAR